MMRRLIANAQIAFGMAGLALLVLTGLSVTDVMAITGADRPVSPHDQYMFRLSLSSAGWALLSSFLLVAGGLLLRKSH